jgi:hypothetical protein
VRHDGWEQILRDYLARSQLLPFEWGENDCCLWVARYVDMVTGTEHTKEWHGRYNTEAGAQALMAARGFPGPFGIAEATLRRKEVTRAARGDVVSFEGGALGICVGRYSYFFVEGKGLSALPTLKCKAAWEV